MALCQSLHFISLTLSITASPVGNNQKSCQGGAETALAHHSNEVGQKTMRQGFCRRWSKICFLASRLRLTSRFLSFPPGGEKRRFLCVSACLIVPTKNHLSTVELCCLQHDVVVAFFIFSFFFFLGCYCDNICKHISQCMCACIQKNESVCLYSDLHVETNLQRSVNAHPDLLVHIM